MSTSLGLGWLSVGNEADVIESHYRVADDITHPLSDLFEQQLIRNAIGLEKL